MAHKHILHERQAVAVGEHLLWRLDVFSGVLLPIWFYDVCNFLSGGALVS